MFLHGLSSLMFWLLLVIALFAVMRWPTGDGRRPHPYPGYGAPGPYDQPSRGTLRPPAWTMAAGEGSTRHEPAEASSGGPARQCP